MVEGCLLGLTLIYKNKLYGYCNLFDRKCKLCIFEKSNIFHRRERVGDILNVYIIKVCHGMFLKGLFKSLVPYPMTLHCEFSAMG